ncbi:uncharacterized protein LOC108601485 [Drosophila busckii]|uniref:uncharacterized protein LOC108601485 n=1 Tax=Drosophila busckii TaxID=30019 RepID=UPI001433019F|nr:uncharacterized protein LOC108601485 [Drosophila busckii]
MEAAQVAQQAYEQQQPAAASAARWVKAKLADQAASAAMTAEAALSSKEEALQQVLAEICEAKKTLRMEKDSVQCYQSNYEAAKLGVDQGRQVVCSLKTAAQLAKRYEHYAKNSEHSINLALQQKQQLLATARKYIKLLSKKLNIARQELCDTKRAAYRALVTAAEARRKVDEYVSRQTRQRSNNDRCHKKREKLRSN